ncbi:beta-ketoacyl-[acyl-carrier-protein] synthase family protein [Dyella caseinilytica]|uniref:Beta-ketoacyl-[acyl-carrier-protein] synthase family protein n=1 Tax=Dyella caseinilytica TaxID=1849581 RepID=A0ABX7GU34_9GAMM|nr:beta-ketoacyl-[acyl-carrier-protein] synthase family protein [Dyella caseinilytica]QRN53478.1 beta-ketoacyl-[acyl-carrier-protein] synthase family protein [Dyella caseinilytica]GFZ86812.1 beta-ketoacyl-[acyl-carrier-protein] synthase II [Dyella caseinilytica]
MSVTSPPLAVTAYTATSAVGAGLCAHLQALDQQRSGLRPNDFNTTPLACWIGRVDGVESRPLPDDYAQWDCRNNRLAWLGLNQDGFLGQVHAARQRYGATRIALLLGTSTASIGATEEGYRRLADNRLPDDLHRSAIHNPHSLTGFIAEALDLHGPCLTISTACSSSAKVFAGAERLIRLGIVDAAVVGGVDSLCDSVLFGFNALELVSSEPCRPFDAARRGISIGEAAGFALLERADANPEATLHLLGCGESSDAHHMSTPDPSGAGAELALHDLFGRAGIDASHVDYINLHGTASQKNDAMEAALVARLFPPHTRVSSTKGLTGHTLGAAGIVEAAITLLALREGFVPGNAGVNTPDPACTPHFAWRNESRPIRIALSHSFGFGGSNACLAFARTTAGDNA